MDLNDIKILPMTLEDLDEVCEIERVSFKSPWTRESYRKEIQDNKLAFYLAAKHKNKVIGYAGSWIVINELHITTLAVKPGYRRQKVAEKLLHYILRESLQKGLQSIDLEVRASNLAAQKLYSKFGFKVAGVRKKYYENDEDAVLMRLEDIKVALEFKV